MSIVKRYWQVEVDSPEGRVTRRFWAERVVVGSSPLAQVKLPQPLPGVAAMLRFEEREYSWVDLGASAEIADGQSWSTFEHETFRAKADIDVIPALRLQGYTVRLRDLSAERAQSALEPERWVENAKDFEDGYMLWHLHQGQLLESFALNGRTVLKSGGAFEWRENAAEATLFHSDGSSEKIAITKGRHGALRGVSGSNIYVITRLPKASDLSRVSAPKAEKSESWVRNAMMGVLATWILMMGLIKFIPATVEEPTLDELSPSIAKLILEAPEAGGGGDGKEGGGGIETTAMDKRGGSGFDERRTESPGSETEVVQSKGALGALAKAEKVLGSGVLKALDVTGKMAAALGSLDEGVKSGKINVASLGGGGRPNGQGAANGVLGAIGAAMGKGSGGGGGVGIGGVGTKGLGGGGGGGNGTGFGTGTGAGLGKGEGPRNLSFGDGPSMIKGGLERAEVEAVIQENIAQIRFCYNKGLQLNPQLEGKVISAFTIGGDGVVARSAIQGSSLREPSVENCIRERVASWKFPEPRGGGKVEVQYPFLLRSN